MSHKITRWIVFKNQGDAIHVALKYHETPEYIQEQIENHEGLYDSVHVLVELADIEFGKKCLQSAYNDLRDLVEVTPPTTKYYIKALEIIGRIIHL